MMGARARRVFSPRTAGHGEQPAPLGTEAAGGVGAAREAALRLLVLIDECVAAGVARQVALLRLSALPPALARPHHLRLAVAALDPLVAADRAARFQLPNRDVAVVWRGEADRAGAEVRAGLAALFCDEAGAARPEELLVLLRLPEDAAGLREAIEALLAPPVEDAAGLRPAPALDPAALLGLERALSQASLASFARRKQVWRHEAGRFVPAWEKRIISIAELSRAVLPERSAQADPWLFRRLTRTLDRRMLALLAAPDELSGAGPFSLNLNVASILSPEFLRFDAALPAGLRGRVTIDLLPADLLSDIAAFLFARDFARTRGYRLLLRGMTPELLEVFPRQRMGLDLIQLRWSAAFAALPPSLLGEEAGHLVLSHCDTPAALACGLARGVAHFLGTAIRPPARGPRGAAQFPLGVPAGAA